MCSLRIGSRCRDEGLTFRLPGWTNKRWSSRGMGLEPALSVSHFSNPLSQLRSWPWWGLKLPWYFDLRVHRWKLFSLIMQKDVARAA